MVLGKCAVTQSSFSADEVGGREIVEPPSSLRSHSNIEIPIQLIGLINHHPPGETIGPRLRLVGGVGGSGRTH